MDSHGRELDFYYEHFVRKAGIQDSNCIALAMSQPGSGSIGGRGSTTKLSKNFNRISQLEVNIEEDGNQLRGDFQRFIGTLASNQSERREQAEMNIMKG